MINKNYYVPIIKSKEGEFKALEFSSEAVKDSMFPLFEIARIQWDYVMEAESKTIESHLTTISKKILDSWGTERSIFIDSNNLDLNRMMTDGATHHLNYIFDDLRAKSVSAVPVTSISKDDVYQGAVGSINRIDKNGVCLRLCTEDFADPLLSEKINRTLQAIDVTKSNVDLILDFAHIEVESRLMYLLVITTINITIPDINEWRSLTFAATAFPIDLSSILAGTLDTIERKEWILYRNLSTADIKRMPWFGDYAIANPEINEIDPRLIQVSANIRYTCDDYWLIARGRGTKKHGYEQFFSLSEDLIAREEYSGVDFSWGDNHINECAARRTTTGNHTTWRKVANNHHFAKVIDQISSLNEV